MTTTRTKKPETQVNADGVEISAPKVEKRKFSDTELIDCVSITSGELFFTGDRSKQLYVWADVDEVIGVEYRDLVYAVRSKNKIMMKPRFIVQDADFLNQNPELIKLYNGMYSTQVLKDILEKPVNEMVQAIKNLPPGAQQTIQSMAMERIERGRLDSIKRIKALDELFDTRMLMRLVSE